MVFMLAVPAMAASTTLIKSKSITLKPGKSYTVKFTTKQKLALGVSYELTPAKKVSSGGLRVTLKNNKGWKPKAEFLSLKGAAKGEEFNGWVISGTTPVKAGKYTCTFKNTTKVNLKIKFNVKGYTKVASSFAFSKNPKIKSGNWGRIGTIKSAKTALPYLRSVVARDKKIITDLFYDLDGKLYAKGTKPGKTVVTVTTGKGKKIKTNVTVTAPDPNFKAHLITYDAYNNCFYVQFDNKGIGTLRVNAKDAIASHFDDVSYSRLLTIANGKSYIDIKPGKSATVAFQVQGEPAETYPNGFGIIYSFTYYGTTYNAIATVNADESAFDNGTKGLYTTYWTN
jgi:hypothetical protein